MLFAIVALDKPASEELRKANRADHLDYLKTFGADLKAAGPFLDDNGTMIGSLVIIEREDKAAAEAFCAGDPYARAGLFQSVKVRVWRWAINPPA